MSRAKCRFFPHSLETSSDLDRILSLSVSYELEKPDESLASTLASAKVPTSLSTVYTAASEDATKGLKWGLEQGKAVDIDVQVVLTEATLEGFEDTVGKAAEGIASPPPIVLCTCTLIAGNCVSY